MKSQLQISSPSALTKEIGANVVQGLNVGMASTQVQNTTASQLISQLADLQAKVKGASAGVTLTTQIRSVQTQLANQLGLTAPAAGGNFVAPVTAAQAAASGGTTNNVTFDFSNARVFSDRDIDMLVSKIGNRLTTSILPRSGLIVKR